MADVVAIGQASLLSPGRPPTSQNAAANGVATAVPSQTARAVARRGSPDALTDAFQAA